MELQLGTPATGLDTGARKVALDGGAFAPAVGERMAAAYAALPCS